MRKVRDYEKYLQSPHWQRTKQRRLAVAGHRCEFRPVVGSYKTPDDLLGDRCETTENLEVHHRHYQSLHAEKDEDLEVVCRFHHLVRGAIGDLDCPECGDGPMGYDEEDVIAVVREAIEDAGSIELVDLQDVRDRASWVITCSYCCR
jgi:hypothetical protein